MFYNKIQSDWIYGFIEKDGNGKKKFNDKDLNDKQLTLSTILKKIKLWFGYPVNREIKSLLGLQATYQNFITGAKITSEYHGCEIKEENIETKELEAKEGDYFSSLNLGFDTYITHIKFTTKKGESIEFGEVNNETEKKVKLNAENNVIMFLTGYQTNNGVRALGTSYISLKNFLISRRFIFLCLRHKLKRDFKNKYRAENEINELPEEMRYVVKTCLLPDVPFNNIIKYC